MRLDNLKQLRQKKKISRAKLAQDLHIDEKAIKTLETTDIINIDEGLLADIANYFNVDKQQIIEKPIPKDIYLYQIVDLCYDILKKHKVLSEKDKELFIQEFKYRIGDIEPDLHMNIKLEENLNTDEPIINSRKDALNLAKQYKDYLTEELDKDEDDDIEEICEVKFTLDSALGFNNELIDNIRKDAKTVSIFYKELLLNGLDKIDCLNLVKAFMLVYYDT